MKILNFQGAPLSITRYHFICIFLDGKKVKVNKLQYDLTKNVS